MIELDQVINYYRQRSLGHMPQIPFESEELWLSTITYLEAFKQVHEMLKRLADAIEGVDLEVGGP